MNRASLMPRLGQSVFVALVLLVWHLVTANGLVNRIVLPRLSDVAAELPRTLLSAQFARDLGTTLFEVACAYMLAAATGLGIGYVVGTSPRRIAEYEPLVAAAYAVPMVLLFPLFVLFFGIGIPSKIAIGAVIAFFPIVLNTIAGFAGVRPQLISAARLMGASHPQILRHVMIPSALPVVVTGLRMGLIVAMLACLGTETIASSGGLGHRMMTLGDTMEPVRQYAYVVLIVVTAGLLNAVAGWIATTVARRFGDVG